MTIRMALTTKKIRYGNKFQLFRSAKMQVHFAFFAVFS